MSAQVDRERLIIDLARALGVSERMVEVAHANDQAHTLVHALATARGAPYEAVLAERVADLVGVDPVAVSFITESPRETE
jgi:predicted TPR repeat methyltransferase